MAISTSKDRWELDKKINVGHIITTVILAVSILTWAKGIEKDILSDKKNIEAIKDRLDRQDKKLETDVKEIKESLRDLNLYIRDNKL